MFSCSEKHTLSTDQGGDLFEPPCSTSTVTPQKGTELENVIVPNLENVTNTSHRTEPSTLPLWRK